MTIDRAAFRITLRSFASFAALVGVAALLLADSDGPDCSRGIDFGASYDVSTTCGGERSASVQLSAVGVTTTCDPAACWEAPTVTVLSGGAFLEDPRLHGTCSDGEPGTVTDLSVAVSDPVDTYLHYDCTVSLRPEDLGRDVTCSSGPTGTSCVVRFSAPAAP